MMCLLWAERLKMRRSKTLWITGFAAMMVAVIVAVQGQFVYMGSRYIDGAYWFMTATQSLGSLYVLPAMIALVGSYMICREEQEDTQKSLDLIPVNHVSLLQAKLIWTAIFSVALYLFLFAISLALELIAHGEGLSFGGVMNQLKVFVLQGFCLFIAVSPIIAFVSKIKKGHWLALLLAEVYSFMALFAGMNPLLRIVYPITAAFCVSGYYEATLVQLLISILSLIACAGISLLILYHRGRREG